MTVCNPSSPKTGQGLTPGLGPDMGLTIRFQIRKHRCTPGALRESQAHRVLKGSPNSQAFQTSHLPRGCQDTKHAPSFQVSLAVVPGRAGAWLVTSLHTQAPARVWIITVPPAVTSQSTSVEGGGWNQSRRRQNSCLSTSVVVINSQQTTQSKQRANR